MVEPIPISIGIIYGRINAWYIEEQVVKIGITSSGKDRDGVYNTGEVTRGYYNFVIEIPLKTKKTINIIDNLLKYNLKNDNIYKGGGTEFYNMCVCEKIEPYLQSLNIKYRVLTKEEIENMERRERIANIKNINNVKKIINKLNLKNIIQQLKNKRNGKLQVNYVKIPQKLIDILSEKIIEPNEQQREILKMINLFYEENNIGKLNWACGLGKALLSILITKLLNFKTVVIGVPSNYLQKQFAKEILRIFSNKSNILFVGGDEIKKSTTNKENINSFLNTNLNNECKFIITSYHSCHLLVDFDFDFKIGDEAHHLVGIEKEEEKGFRLFHKITSLKTLFMTATEKNIESKNNSFSMDDELVFGKYIDIKTVKWAIENKKITDYKVITIKSSEDQVDELIIMFKIDVCNKELFISCYMCLKSIEKYKDLTHILLYVNTTKDAELSKIYIYEILKLNILSINIEDIYNKALHSNSNCEISEETKLFRDAKYGIISCVYIFGEGVDLPKLNGVCIAGNMYSEIRIIQYLLRANRLDEENPDKIAYYIINYFDSDNWEIEKKSFEKVRPIMTHFRNVDENIEQKIFVSCLIKREREQEQDEERKQDKEEYEKRINCDYEFIENGNELTKLKLRLRYSKSLGSKFTEEQDEFNYVKSINKSLNIQSEKEYIDMADKHINFIPEAKKYFEKKSVWTNWYDFMGVDITKFIQIKQDWINFCREKKINNREEYIEACKLYDILPKEPEEFYTGFGNILSELSVLRIIRR